MRKKAVKRIRKVFNQAVVVQFKRGNRNINERAAWRRFKRVYNRIPWNKRHNVHIVAT